MLGHERNPGLLGSVAILLTSCMTLGKALNTTPQFTSLEDMQLPHALRCAELQLVSVMWRCLVVTQAQNNTTIYSKKIS